MLRKTTCAVVGIALACAAGYSLFSVLAQSQALSSLDLRWIYTSAKQDRLPVDAVRNGGTVVLLDRASHATTIVTRVPARRVMESAVQTPRPTSVRTVPVQPVREVPNEEATKQRLPEGCEPAFSPVTTPAFAHIGVRCDS
jgi:hypothetical protein